MATSETSLPSFGVIGAMQHIIPFKCIALSSNETITTEHLADADIVLAAGDANNQLHISALCKESGIKCVYIIEYAPETRRQIVSLETKNLLLRLRRYLYLAGAEKKRNFAFSLADGLQSNGVPAYFEYNKYKHNLLYFDTRVYAKNGICDSDLECRLNELSKGSPLRLAFSGRLIRMKGADHLVRLALKLRREKTGFHFMIYGAGELEVNMKRQIRENHLENNMILRGPVDFYNELIPDLKKSVDLFVCLHRQGDPSCTYLETLSCGVPIIGYGNKAFSGLLDLADIGWGAKVNDLDGVCKAICFLNNNRKEISEKARNSAKFSRQHDFETTFQNRINHCLSLLG